MSRVFAAVYLHFLQNPSDYLKVKNRLAVIPVTERKWSDYIGGLDILHDEFEAIRILARTRIEDRHSAFMKAHTVDEYKLENNREWNELHQILGVWSDETGCLPYPNWA